MRQALGGIETDTGLLNRDCSAMPILVFTEDHRAETIARVVAGSRNCATNMNIESLDYQLEHEALEDVGQRWRKR